MTTHPHTEASIRDMIAGLPEHVQPTAVSLLADPWGDNFYTAMDHLAEGVLEMESFEELYEAGNLSVPCRLCGSLGHAIQPRGYIYPEGIRRHIAGSHKARMCEVTKAIIDYARARDRAA